MKTHIKLAIYILPVILVGLFLWLPRTYAAGVCTQDASGNITSFACCDPGDAGQDCKLLGSTYWYYNNGCKIQSDINTPASTCYNTNKMTFTCSPTSGGCAEPCRISGQINCGGICQYPAANTCATLFRNYNSCSGCTTCLDGYSHALPDNTAEACSVNYKVDVPSNVTKILNAATNTVVKRIVSVADTDCTAGDVPKWDNTNKTWVCGAAGGASNWTPSGSNIYSNNSGNVGIGVNNATTKFQVEESDNSIAIFGHNTYNSNSTTQSGVYGQSSGPGTGTNTGVYGLGNTGTGTNIGVFGTASGGATNWAGYFDGNVFMNGNVGIGTTTLTSGYKLTVSGGNIGVDNAIVFAAKNSAGTYENYLWPRYSNNIMYMNYGSGGLLIRDNSSNTAMFMDSNRNVGIGTTGPSAKLHVVDDSATTGIKNLLILDNKKTAAIGDGAKLEFRENNDTQPTGRIYTQMVSAADYTSKLNIGSRWYDGSTYVHDDMTLSGGNVGIGNTSPAAKLDVAGSILSAGTTGGTPVLGAGTRLMWIPAKSAFRAGTVGADSWDDANIGWYSTAMGRDTKASAYYSTAIGYGAIANGTVSTAIGYNPTASGSYSTAVGSYTTASGYASTAMGESTTASSADATALGYGTIANSSQSTAMGNTTTASGPRSTAMGYSTTASGYQSTAMGYSTIASGDNSTAIGYAVTAEPYASVAVGRYNVTNAGWNKTGWTATDPLFVIGNGTGSAATSNAMTVTKNGRIGINAITSPSARLEIQPPSGNTDKIALIKTAGGVTAVDISNAGHVYMPDVGTLSLTGDVIAANDYLLSGRGLWDTDPPGSAGSDTGLFDSSGGWMRFVTDGGEMRWFTHNASSWASHAFNAYGTDADADMKLTPAGKLYTRAGYVTGSIDIAEWTKVSDSDVSAGDVVVIDPSNISTLTKSSKAENKLVAGIISTQPGFIGGNDIGKSDEEMEQQGYRMLALAGQVPCNVTDENGAVEVGDLLVTSSTPGYAMKSPETPKAGTVLGKALEPLAKGKGKVMVLVTLQ